MQCEELKKESEEEVRKHLKGYEEQVKSIESENQGILKERDQEVSTLKEANDQLKVEIDRMREREGEAERQMNELRDHFQKQLMEKQSKVRMKDEETEEKFLKREREVEEREQDLSRHEEELSKRGHELDTKEEALVKKEGILESKEQTLQKWEASLEIKQREQEEKDRYEKDVNIRAEKIQKMERELESLLQALEGKQKELNSHGQDLQKKVKGLKDQGKELKDREYYLRNEEQELLSWKSELQMQNEHVNFTTQELDDMRRDMALLKEELRAKETNLKMSFDKLRKWQQSLEEREAELCKRGQSQSDRDAVESSEDDLRLMYEEVSVVDEQERKEKGKGREDGNDREVQRTKAASSAAENNKCHLETLKGMETAGKELESAKVMRDFKVLSSSQGHRSSNDTPGTELRVVVLGESWSSRSPAGVTILGGEGSKVNGSTFRPWRGQIAGRHLAVAEPFGLKWRDGPDPTNTAQRTSILDCISWCRPGPHVVLLLMPAFLTCTKKYRRAVEEHMSLLGEDIWQRTLLLFTWGETLGVSAEQHILRNGELIGLVERCGGRYHVLTSKRSSSLTEGLFEKMDDIVALNSREQFLV